MNTTHNDTPFSKLGLSQQTVETLTKLGYEQPSPIQAQTIPHLLAGQDLVGQAQTGTGKTAAFALPIIEKLDLSQRKVQALILAPTRELAIQVAEALHSYAASQPGIHILPVYGGQSFGIQLKQLKRGVHIVVGTPGRVMDHMRRGTLTLDGLSTLVLDEADEMLRMGFIDDVEWIIENTPAQRQMVLFSATMPSQIRKIARTHLKQPAEITIKQKTTTASTIRQRYWLVKGTHKLDAMTRILEAEDFDGMIVFVRTKLETINLAEKLEARGFRAAALNGDIPQNQREEIVDKLKKERLDILVATDVVARGLDVERVSHVVNYDIPYDTESYVHRIGRTGRAGRNGEAILFVAPRERRMLHAIEKATRQKIQPMVLPSAQAINTRRIEKLYDQLDMLLKQEDLEGYQQIIERYIQTRQPEAEQLAAALLCYAQGEMPFLLSEKKAESWNKPEIADYEEVDIEKKKRKQKNKSQPVKQGMQRFKLNVGRKHGVKPGQIVGAIANEADIDSAYIGAIKIHEHFSLVDLPEGMPKETFQTLQKARVCQRPLDIKPDTPKSGNKKKNK